MIDFVISSIISFISTLFFIRLHIDFCKEYGFLGKDIHKKSKELIPDFAGPPVLFGFLMGLFVYTLFNLDIAIENIAIALIISSITLLLTLEDVSVMKRKSYKKSGLRGLNRLVRIYLPFFLAFPLIALKSNKTSIYIPLLGNIDFGFFYYFIILLSVLCASNVTNMLAGFNGLEASLGLVATFFISLMALLKGNYAAFSLGVLYMSCLLAFLYYNWYPARIFPGDSLSYQIGALIASIAILADLEFYALIIFIPWIIEFFLKLRGRLKLKKWPESFGKLEDGKIVPRYDKIYSMTHIAMRFFHKETSIVIFLIFIVLIFCTISFTIFLFNF